MVTSSYRRLWDSSVALSSPHCDSWIIGSDLRRQLDVVWETLEAAQPLARRPDEDHRFSTLSLPQQCAHTLDRVLQEVRLLVGYGPFSPSIVRFYGGWCDELGATNGAIPIFLPIYLPHAVMAASWSVDHGSAEWTIRGDSAFSLSDNCRLWVAAEATRDPDPRLVCLVLRTNPN